MSVARVPKQTRFKQYKLKHQSKQLTDLSNPQLIAKIHKLKSDNQSLKLRNKALQDINYGLQHQINELTDQLDKETQRSKYFELQNIDLNEKFELQQICTSKDSEYVQSEYIKGTNMNSNKVSLQDIENRIYICELRQYVHSTNICKVMNTMIRYFRNNGYVLAGADSLIPKKTQCSLYCSVLPIQLSNMWCGIQMYVGRFAVEGLVQWRDGSDKDAHCFEAIGVSRLADMNVKCLYDKSVSIETVSDSETDIESETTIESVESNIGCDNGNQIKDKQLKLIWEDANISNMSKKDCLILLESRGVRLNRTLRRKTKIGVLLLKLKALSLGLDKTVLDCLTRDALRVESKILNITDAGTRQQLIIGIQAEYNDRKGMDQSGLYISITFFYNFTVLRF